MKVKNLILNSSLFAFSVYASGILFSIIDYFFISSDLINASRIKDIRTYKDIKKRIDALELGMMPVYSPWDLFQTKNIPKIYPIGSIPLTKSYFCNEGYGLSTYITDRFGLRNKDKKWEKAQKQNNIFLVGDSFTHGACVSNEQTISNNIEKKTKLNTFNLGSKGNDPYEYISTMRSLVKPIIQNSRKKNKVVLIFFANDNVPVNITKEELLMSLKSIVKINKEGTVSPTKYYVDAHKEFIFNNFPTEKDEIIKKIKGSNFLKSFKKSSIKSTALYSITTLVPIRSKLRIFKKRFFSRPNIYPNITLNSESISERSISVLSEICNQSCKPYVAYIPNSTYWNRMSGEDKSKKYKNSLISKSQSLSIPFIDGEKIIDQSDKKNYSPKGGHLSIKGYENISELISETIEDY